jgi:rare lipoprotein A
VADGEHPSRNDVPQPEGSEPPSVADGEHHARNVVHQREGSEPPSVADGGGQKEKAGAHAPTAEVVSSPPSSAKDPTQPSETQDATASVGNLVGSGHAVWYQHPGRTANGEVYNPDGLTAAHRTLRFGTWVRVVNKENGRSVVLRINDRINTRETDPNSVIDLSRGSARALGIESAGSVAVEIYELPD